MAKDVKSQKNLTDEELILLVQKRDQEAFAELIKRYTPRMWRVIPRKFTTTPRRRRDTDRLMDGSLEKYQKP